MPANSHQLKTGGVTGHCAMTGEHGTPLTWLLKVNILQGWRRLLAIRDQSRLLTFLIGGFIAGYLAFAYWLFYRGLHFAASFVGFGSLLVERLMFLLFAFLFVLMLFSNLVIGYTNLFRNREAHFLLTLPLPFQTIFRWKFLESTLLASWAFLFLIAPLLMAYGVTHQVAWHFYPAAGMLILISIILPAVAGAWLAVLMARFLERRIFQLIVVGSSLVAITAMAFYFKPEPMPDNPDMRVLVMLDKMLARTRFAEQAFLPSYWLATGILNWAEGALSAAAFFGLVLFSHALFWGYFSFTKAGRVFYEAASSVQSRGSVLGQWQWFQRWRQHQKDAAWQHGPMESFFRKFPWINSDVRALVIKDIRLFWRDTTQWGQTIVLFGLLGVYIINLRHFTNQLTNPFWVHLVSYLNLCACALNLATLTTRFVFPQFSLEGKRVWIVGLAPLGLPQVLKVKFWLSSIGSLIVTLGLITLSCHMLKMPWDRLVFFAATITIMTFTLNGLAVGLGALYPNFKEDHPGKIVSGFGGTFCLVLSFVYIVVSVALVALGVPAGRVPILSPMAQTACWLGFLLLSVVLGWIPMKLALQRVSHYEL